MKPDLHKHFRSDRRLRRRRGNHDGGFTIVELLVAIFIIGLLVTISVMVIGKARRSAAMARVKADFVAIGVALDQFKADHKSFPGMVPNLPPGVDVNNALAYCLVSPEPATVDGADGPGFRVQKSAPNTKLWPAYLDAATFKALKDPKLADGRTLNRGWELLDAYEMPIIYMPRRKPGIKPSVALFGDSSSNAPGIFDINDVAGVLDQDQQNGLKLALGDANLNNRIDGGETLKFSGDYLLMSAGPDAAFFNGTSPVEFGKADDVYNFDR